MMMMMLEAVGLWKSEVIRGSDESPDLRAELVENVSPSAPVVGTEDLGFLLVHLKIHCKNWLPGEDPSPAQSHHFLMELPAKSPMDESDLDLGKEAAQYLWVGWILRDMEERRLRRPPTADSFGSACDTRNDGLLSLVGMTKKLA